MKPYAVTCVLLTYWLVMFMIALPYLWSADDTILCGVAFALSLGIIPISYILIKEIWNTKEVQSIIKQLGELK